MSRRTHMILSLTTREIRGALVKNGDVVQAESCGFDDGLSWTESWDDGLRPFDQALRQLVSRFSKKNAARVTLIYQSPSAIVQFDEMDGTKQSALDRAEAKIRELVGVGGCVSSKLVGHNVDDGDEKHSCLTIADQDATTRKLYAWMMRCGLRADRMIPAGCAMMAQAIETSFQQADETAVCYMGEESSVISYVNEGCVRLVRSIEIGHRHLSDAYRGALESRDDEVNIGEDTAQFLAGSGPISDMIWDFGVPIVLSDEGAQVLRREVLPRIAPVLQRYSVEIKQTFRFGLSASEFPSKLVICGPGAAIPHLSSALSQNCDLHIEMEKGSEVYASNKPFGVGTLEGKFAESRAGVPSVLPRIAIESKQRSACNKSIAAGLALAVGIMVFELASVHIQSKTILEEINRDEPRVSMIQNEQVVRELAANHAESVGRITSVFTDSFGVRPQWSSSFSAISESMSRSIRIEQIHGNNAGKKPSIKLTGLVVGTQTQDPAVMLNEFATALRAHDGILDVHLGATSTRSTAEGNPAVHFELDMPIRANPAPFNEYTAYVGGNEKGVSE